MFFIGFPQFPNKQWISSDSIGFHENRWEAPAGAAAGGRPGTEYMDVLGTQEFIDSGGDPPESMNSLALTKRFSFFLQLSGPWLYSKNFQGRNGEK